MASLNVPLLRTSVTLGHCSMCLPPTCNSESHAEAEGPEISLRPGALVPNWLHAHWASLLLRKSPDLSVSRLVSPSRNEHGLHADTNHIWLLFPVERFTHLQATCTHEPVWSTGKGPKAWFQISSHLAWLCSLEQTTPSLGFLICTRRPISAFSRLCQVAKRMKSLEVCQQYPGL